MPHITFIRHAEKKYNNNKGPPGCYQHDPDIFSFSSDMSKKLYKNNQFDIVICSPFLRTRQTVKQILFDLEMDIPVIINNEISEYLGFQKPIGKDASLHPETKKLISAKLGIENFLQLRNRLIKFYNDLKQYGDKNILVVTHGINICFLHEIIFDREIASRPGILEGFDYYFD